MLEIRNLHKTFNPDTPNAVLALDKVSLCIAPGSFTIVIGSNGSGKSTLLNAVAGTFPPDGGQIVLDGHDVTRWPEHRRARYIGRVFQNPFSGTAPQMSIAENFSLAALRGKRRGLGWALNHSLIKEVREQIAELGMNLEDRLHNEIGTLSGGQRQALTLLMATYLKPSLLLLDEHTAALDPGSADQIIALTRRVIERDHLTAMMVTHSMSQAVALGDRLVMMHHGAITLDVCGEEKRKLTIEDLLAHFNKIRRHDQAAMSQEEILQLDSLQAMPDAPDAL